MIGVLKWLLAALAAALLGVALLAYRDAALVFRVMANGTEAMALIEGGANGIRPGAAGTYLVDLVWTDSAGAARKAGRLDIDHALARQLGMEAATNPPAVLIKYLPDEPGTAPVIVRQAAPRRERDRFNILAAGIGSAVCALGFVVFSWLGRRGPD